MALDFCRNCFYAKAFTFYETHEDYLKVVRCKDCLWAVTPYGDEGDGFIECTNLYGRPLFREDSFCSCGERKDNDSKS